MEPYYVLPEEVYKEVMYHLALEDFIRLCRTQKKMCTQYDWMLKYQQYFPDSQIKTDNLTWSQAVLLAHHLTVLKRELPLDQYTLLQLSNLKILFLSGNQIKEIPPYLPQYIRRMIMI